MVNNHSERALAAASPAALTIRKATLADIDALLSLINAYAAEGVMLPRTEFELSENIRDFVVAYSGETLLGCGALHFYSPQMGEVRSLAVAPRAKGSGTGKRIVEALAEEAAEFGLDAIFAFTYVPGFFARAGFDPIERGLLPLKAWKDCLRCAKFASCDEIAVLRVIDPARWAGDRDTMRLESLLAQEDIAFPILKNA